MKNQLIKQVLFFMVLGILFTLMTCMSSGSLLRDTAASDKQNSPVKTAAPASTPTKTPAISTKTPEGNTPAPTNTPLLEEEEEPYLHITTSPGSAMIYINNSFEGYSTLDIYSLTEGEYKITARLEGYYEKTIRIGYFEEYREVHLDLEPIVGYLEFSTNAINYTATAAGRSTSGRKMTLPVGTHNFRLEAFGYQTFSTTITIEEKRTTVLEATMTEAELEVSNFRCSRKRFNPANPGISGIVTIRFHVSSFGKGSLSLQADGGQKYQVYDFPSFNTWEQQYTWDGRDSSGNIIPDGTYRLVLKTSGHQKEEVQELSLIIDSSLVISLRSLFSGTSGLLYSGSPDALPSGAVQGSLQFLIAEAGDLTRVPVSTAFRFGLPWDSELDLGINSIITSYDSMPLNCSLSYKKHLFLWDGPLAGEGAIQIKGANQWDSYADTFTNFTGFSAGFPLKLKWNNLSFLLHPEIIGSPYRVIYGDSSDQASLFRSWGYLRGGLLAEMGSVTAGLSCTLRTTPFNEAFAIDLPLNGALEIHYQVPRSAAFYSIVLAGEFVSVPDNFYTMFGFSTGFLF